MDRVWNRDDVTTVRDIFDELAADRVIAYTTVLSTMDNLHRKGWLERERVGKAYHYRPAMTREEYSAKLMRDAFEAGGDTNLVLSHFLDQMNDAESAQVKSTLRRFINRRAGA